MKRFVEFLISFVKRRSFKFDKRVTSSYLISLLVASLSDSIRGAFKFKFGAFVGSGTVILAKRQIKSSGSVKIGRFCKVDALSEYGIHLGHNFALGDYSVLKVSGSLSDLGDSIKIGDNVGIGEFSYIGGAGGVEIGNDTIIGQYLSCHPENHYFSDPSELIRLQGVSRKGIKVGGNCWVGAKVTFLDGSEVGNGCIVAAGAVVSGQFPDNVIIGGVPAKIIKMREN